MPPWPAPAWPHRGLARRLHHVFARNGVTSHHPLWHVIRVTYFTRHGVGVACGDAGPWRFGQCDFELPGCARGAVEVRCHRPARARARDGSSVHRRVGCAALARSPDRRGAQPAARCVQISAGGYFCGLTLVRRGSRRKVKKRWPDRRQARSARRLHRQQQRLWPASTSAWPARSAALPSPRPTAG
jgi:hypothetical protein